MSHLKGRISEWTASCIFKDRDCANFYYALKGGGKISYSSLSFFIKTELYLQTDFTLKGFLSSVEQFMFI